MPELSKNAVEDLYRDWARRGVETPAMSIAEMRDMMEGWHNVTTEAPGVCFEDVVATSVEAMWCIPGDARPDSAIVYTHGGGYCSGSMHSHRKIAAHVARAANCRVLNLDYRLAPEYQHPAPCEDAVRAWDWLVEGGFSPARMGLAGDSAGGGLALATALALRDAGKPLPSALFLISPFVDMELTGETMASRAELDLCTQRELLQQLATMFLGDTGANDHLASPLLAPLEGLPPIFVTAGDDEVLLDDSVRLARKARAAGVDIRFEQYPGMQHCFALAVGKLAEADDVLAKFSAWVRPLLGTG